MDTITHSGGNRFLAAFNEIEDRFRRVLGLDAPGGPGVRFPRATRRA